MIKRKVVLATQSSGVDAKVRTRCVMAPTLFSTMFTAMLTDAFQDSDASLHIRYHLTASYSNVGGCQAKSECKVSSSMQMTFIHWYYCIKSCVACYYQPCSNRLKPIY